MLSGIVHWLSDWDNSTGLIAIISFIMTSITWGRTLHENRQNLAFHIHEFQSHDDISFFFMQIENHSKLPVAITRFQLIIDDSAFDCTPIPNFIYEYTRRSGKEVTSRKTFYSLQMPIEVSALGAISGYILFEGSQVVLPTDSTMATFQVCTNRKRKEKISLPLPADVLHK